jgi:phage shock protein PspC (stress-responsive transcriptional regulator)
MEKTTQITLAKTVFSLTESAYEKLSAYLETLKAHFVGEAESAEIMRDIESRIAEKLFHKKHDVITEADIAAVTAEIGDASEFDDEEEAPAERPKRVSKKLFRDTSNAYLGGVASGIAAYFDIDPLWIRLAFLVSLFFGGAGVFIYIVLWIIIPEAKSTSQKLEMHGHPVDLEGIKRVVQEGVDGVRESGILRRFVAFIGSILRAIFRSIGKVVGAFITLGSFAGVIALTIFLGIIITNWNAPYNDFPLRDAVDNTLLVGGLFVGYIAALIPLIFVFALGLRLTFRKNVLPSAIGFGLFGVWALFLIAGGIIGTKIAGEFYQYTETSPAYQKETRALEVGTFDSIDIREAHVTLKSGPRSLSVEGRALEAATVNAEVIDGTLMLSEVRNEKHLCIFCSHSSPDIIVTTPDISSVTLVDGSLVFKDFAQDSLSLTAESSIIRGTLSVGALEADIESSSFFADLTGTSLTLKSTNGHLNLDGTLARAEMTLADSNLFARTLAIGDLIINADSSNAEVNVSGTLEHPRLVDSLITNVGREKLEQIRSETDIR